MNGLFVFIEMKQKNKKQKKNKKKNEEKNQNGRLKKNLFPSSADF